MLFRLVSRGLKIAHVAFSFDSRCGAGLASEGTEEVYCRSFSFSFVKISVFFYTTFNNFCLSK